MKNFYIATGTATRPPGWLDPHPGQAVRKLPGGRRSAYRDAMVRNTLGLLAIFAVAGCAMHDERDPAKSATRLDLAKDFLRKHQLEAADSECSRALAFNPANDEAYNV
ncbi:MAG TPA: hypothetical protein VF516_05490, partial [Kofleriaceae bacterium]